MWLCLSNSALGRDSNLFTHSGEMLTGVAAVTCEDYSGVHVPGALNWPCSSWVSEIDQSRAG